ncbi:hypothetical protein FRC12_013888 [Ceratobasidium sp. 428]|nr:hypothetical protein FRC12_013888 [Ceratobasidium sp. 428]
MDDQVLKLEVLISAYQDPTEVKETHHRRRLPFPAGPVKTISWITRIYILDVTIYNCIGCRWVSSLKEGFTKNFSVMGSWPLWKLHILQQLIILSSTRTCKGVKRSGVDWCKPNLLFSHYVLRCDQRRENAPDINGIMEFLPASFCLVDINKLAGGWMAQIQTLLCTYNADQQSARVSFGGGQAPYHLEVFKLAVNDNDALLVTIPNLMGDSATWVVTEPPTSIVRFQITDSIGSTVPSKWLYVYADPAASTSTASVLSTISVASILSTQAYISRLSASAQGASATGSASSAPPSNHQNPGPIIGGVLGGVAVLLIIALAVFWRLRPAYPRPASGRNGGFATDLMDENQDAVSKSPAITPYNGVITTTYHGMGPNVGMPYNPYQPQHPPPTGLPMLSAPTHVQPQPAYGFYGGMPVIQQPLGPAPEIPRV